MGLMKKLTSVIVTAGLLVGLVGTAFAASPADIATGADRMQKLGIIKGDGNGDLKLNDSITRAELVTIIVRAFGKENDASYLKGAPVYPDTASHWASGYIVLAKNIIEGNGFSMGMPDGTFAPQGKVNAAQAVAFLMKFLGVPADKTQAWPNDFLGGAVAAGLITADEKAELAADGDAQRGLVFYLADKAFYGYKLADGKTMYTKYVKPQAPTVTIDDVASPTTEAKVTVTGTVSSDATAVYLGTSTTPVQVVGGKFSAEVELALGEQEISVTAADLAGHTVSDSIKVTRTVGAAASIAVASELSVAAGGSADLAIVVKDATGNVISDAPVAVSESTLGTYAGGVFTAGTKVGAGTITVTSGDLTKTVNVTVTAGALAKVEAEDVSVAPGESTKLVAKDQYGNVVEGATFSQTSADALVDAATGTFIASEAGTYTVKATKGDVTVEGKVGVYGDVASLVVSAPASIIANETTEVEVTVTAVDEAGNVVTDFDGDITIDTLLTDVDEDETETAENGVATFTLTALGSLADQEVDIVASYDDDDVDVEADAEGETAIAAVAQVATSIKVSAPDYLPTNSDGDLSGKNVTVKVLDQAGEDMLEGAWEFSVKLTGPATLEAGDDVTEDDITLNTGESFPVYPSDAGETGDVNVTVSFTGLTSGNDTMKAAFAQDPAKLVVSVDETTTTVDNEAALEDADEPSENYVEFKVTVADKNGVPVESEEPATVVVSFEDASTSNTLIALSDDAGTTYDDYVAIGSDDIALTFDNGVSKFRVAGKKAGSFKVVVEDTADEDALTAAAETTVTLESGSADIVGFENDWVNVYEDAAQGTVTAQLYDEFGNKVAKSGVKLTFSDAADADRYDGFKLNGKADDVDVTTDADGKASVEVTFAGYASGAAITVENDDLTTGEDAEVLPAHSAAIYEEIGLVVADFVPTDLTVSIITDLDGNYDTSNDQTRVSAYTVGGEGIYVKAVVEDNFGRAFKDLLSVGEHYQLKLTASNDDLDDIINDDDAPIEFEEVLDADDEGTGVYIAGPIDPEVAESLTFTVEVANLSSELKASKAVSIRSGIMAGVDVVEADDDDAITFDTDKVQPYTVRVVDAAGNPVSSSQVNGTVKVTFETEGGEVRNADGKTVDIVSIAKGRTTAKFYFIADAEDEEVVLTAWVEKGGDDDATADVDESETYDVADGDVLLDPFTVNP